MLQEFSDWRTKTITIKQLTTTVNSSGVPIEGESTVVADLKVNYWTDVSRETSTNDKFVDQAIGTILVPTSYTLDTTMWFETDGEKHYITGVDNVAALDKILVVSWRRAYGE
jgi:hypothetical protein